MSTELANLLRIGKIKPSRPMRVSSRACWRPEIAG